MKTCTKCGQTKPIDAYHRDRQKRDGRTPLCRECVKAYNAAYRKENREEIRARKAAYYRANREKLRAQNAAYRRANREEISARAAVYYEETIRARRAEAAERYQAEGAFPIPAEVLAHRV